MSLPDGFLDELRSRVSLARVVGRRVTWDQRRSNQTRGDMWAPCPFHQEKTASFHVDDREGFYYCFGCHAKGDAIGFIRETENVGFVEAVEILAREVGLPLPERDPAARARSDRRAKLSELVEAAVRHYRVQLRTAASGPARDYLAGRGLSEAALERWEIGFAPDGWRSLCDAMAERGVPAESLVEAGLAKVSDRGGQPFDFFRNRILFPIRDARGRAVGFGGRAIDPGEKAKYINSPQSALFDKGRSLFNHRRAREQARPGEPLLVAEGYMDVIALSEAGFGAAVAPLGTAITEVQLQALWRLHPEPVVALDGDAAGLRAARGLLDLALPLLGPGRSLRFCLLPEGRDPDDVLRADGPTAMRRLIEAAQPLVSLLWQRETEGRSFDSPERRAELDAALRRALRQIGDAGLRRHYADELRRRRADLFGEASRPWRQRRPSRGAAAPETRASLLAASGDASTEELREAVILATLIAHPLLLDRFEGELERLDMVNTAHGAVRRTLLGAGPGEDLRARVAEELGEDALERLFSTAHVRIAPGLRDASDTRAAFCVAEELAKLAARRGARRDVAEAMAAAEAADENVLWRVRRAAEVLSGLQRQAEAAEEYETAPSGARMRREERLALDQLIGTIDYSGGRRPRLG